VTLGGETFPINTYFGLGIKTIMNDPKNFPDPEKFLPERWSNAELMSPFSFLTFSAGPRNCIGEKLAMLEIKIMLIEFVRLFGLSINPKASFKMKIEQVYRMTDEFMVVPMSKQPTDKNT
jgi:cytochrome P450